MKEPIYKVSCIVIGSKCAVMRSTSQLVDSTVSVIVLFTIVSSCVTDCNCNL